MNSRNSRGGRFSRGGASNSRRSVRPKKATGLDPNLLVQKASTTVTADFQSTKLFSSFELEPNLIQNIEKKGYKHPTQIQEEAIQPLIEGRNMIGIANTGTGKTGAFLIPIIQQLLTGGNFTSLVIVPTRELALQVEQEFKSLTGGMKLHSACFIGGTSVPKDIHRLRRGVQIIVGTPGRLLDLANRGSLRLQDYPTLVLDEFDRMLDMGFINDIKKIVGRMKIRKQTMLFSATIESNQKRLIEELVDNPVTIQASTGSTSSKNVEQAIIRVGQGEDKFGLLVELLTLGNCEKVIIFTETKRLVDRVSQRLNKEGIKAGLIHGDKSQNYRNKAISQFKKGLTQVLVATDVAARGIDIDDVSHVINYQMPRTMDSYVHRIGRTGRAGKTGMAYTFVDQA